ncbi:MAG TPA: hypothetical protein VI030_10805 [Propionibacteriaceae bacterium]
MSHRSPSAQVLTIMMTKIVGSAALRRVRGDRDADEILGFQAQIVYDKVIAFGGRAQVPGWAVSGYQAWWKLAAA